MGALREVLLERIKAPIVICLDEIDFVRNQPFSSDEFFAGLRELYNRRTEDPELHRLRFCLLGVATPSDLIRDTHTTPFNIGTRIELADFDEEQVTPLLRGLKRDNDTGKRLLKRILYWTGGHPYLTQSFCHKVAADSTVKGKRDIDRKCGELFLSSEARKSNPNVHDVSKKLLGDDNVNRAALLDLYQKIRKDKDVVDDETNPLINIVRLSGITRTTNGLLRVRNEIYRRAFGKAWVQAHMPEAEARRQKAAYRRGALKAATIAAIVIALLTGVTVYAFVQRQLARDTAEQLTLSLAQREEALKQTEQSKEDFRREKEKKQHALETAEVESARRKDQAERADQQRRRAEEATAREIKSNEVGRRLVYGAKMLRGQQFWETGHLSGLEKLLDEPVMEKGFEWYYLEKLFRGVQFLEGSADFNSVDLSPNGALFVTSGANGTAELWSTGTGKKVRELDAVSTAPEKSVGIYSIGFSGDGKRIIGATTDRQGKVWDAETGRIIATLTGDEKGLWAAALSRDGKYAVTGSEDTTAKIWDVEIPKPPLTLKGHNQGVMSVAFSPDGKRVFTGSRDQTIKIWDRETGVLLRTIQGHSTVFTLAVSPDGKRVVAPDWDTLATVWDVETGEPLLPLEGHGDQVVNVLYSPDGSRIVTGSKDKTSKVWNAKTGELLKTVDRYGGGFVDAVFTAPNGEYVAVSITNKVIEFWNPETTAEPLKLVGHTGAIWDVAISADNRLIATGSTDNLAIVWNAYTGAPVQTFKGHTKAIRGVAFSPDGKRLVTGSLDESAIVWSVDSGRQITQLHCKLGQIMAVAFSPDGKWIATGGDSGAKVWDSNTGDCAFQLIGHTGRIHRIAFSHDGRSIVTGGDDNTAKIWDAKTGHLKRILEGHRGTVVGVDFSFDDKNVLTGSEDSTAKIWNVATGRMEQELQGYSHIYRVAYAPRGSRAITSGDDKTAKIWDLVTGREVFTLKDNAVVVSVAFSSDGTYVVTGGADQTASVWRINR
jgi:WD40 repeat protein